MKKNENMETQQHGEEEAEKAFVLWDIGNCPIPDGHDPLTVVQRIQTAVEKSGYVRRYGEISITAIGNNLTQVPGEDVMRKLYSIGISFKHGHHYSHDLYDWARENPPPGTMMVIDGHEQLGWIAPTLSDFEDKGYRILLAYPQLDPATPLPRIFSKQWDQKRIYTYNGSPPPTVNVSRSAIEWDWDALISDEQELKTPTTSLVVSHDKLYPWPCGVCFVAAPSLEVFTTHLKSVEHEFGEWDRYASKYALDRTNRDNLPFGRSQELDLLLTQEMRRIQEILSQPRRPGGFKPKYRSNSQSKY